MHPRFRLFFSLVAVGVVLVAAAKYLLPLVGPLVLGVVIASLIEPPVSWLEGSCRLPRWLAAGAGLALVLMALGLVMAVLSVNLWLSLRELALGEQGRQIYDLLGRVMQEGAKTLAALPDPWGRVLPEIARELPFRLLDGCRASLRNLGRLPEWLFLLFLGVISAYFFCRDRTKLAGVLLAVTPHEWRRRAAEMRNEMSKALAGYIRAQLVLFCLVAMLGALGLATIGVKQALLIGVFLGLLDIWPTIGPGTVLLPWSGMALVAGQWLRALGLVVLFLVLAAVREMAAAKVMGKNLGLHPLAALAAIYIGLRLFGIGGVLIGPLILVILRALSISLRLPGDPAGAIPERGRA